MYDAEEGRMLWHQKTGGAVLFGWQEADLVYAAASDRKIYAFDKKGEADKVYACDDSVYSCATAEQGKYIFAGDNCSSLYCFNKEGERLWKLGSGCGAALSMQYANDKLYIVTTGGYLVCIDASEAAIADAQAGKVPEAVNIEAPKTEGIQPSNTLATTSDTSQGVLVECYKSGSKLRVRVLSDGYNANWNVQFPKNIREDGAKYTVEEIKESVRGGFYRAFGEIKKLV